MTSDAERLLQQMTRVLNDASSDEARLEAYWDGTKSLTTALNDGMATGGLSALEATRLWRAWTEEARQALPQIKTVHFSAQASDSATAERDE